MHRRNRYISILFIVAIVCSSCSKPATEVVPTEIESSETVADEAASVEEVVESEEVVVSEEPEEIKETVYLPVDMGEPIGMVIEASSLPSELLELKMKYPSGLYTRLNVTYRNTETKENRTVDFFLNEGEEGYINPLKHADEIIAGYSFIMITKDASDQVDAYYESLGPDDYVTYINPNGPPYPIFNFDNEYGFGAEFAMTEINATDDPTNTSNVDIAFKELGYITYISAGCEWVPKN